MEIKFQSYNYLPEESKIIRKTVFVDEQGFVDEFDESDNHSIHILMFVDNVAIGTTRIIYSEVHKSITIGRVAILKEYRGHNYGKAIMEYTEQVIIEKYGHIQIGVSSQEQAEEFYKKVGYNPTNERYLDQYCPHVWMIKKL